MKNSSKGFVFYINENNVAYYINSKREHIMIPGGLKSINKDNILKDIIKRTAKEYTLLGYERKIVDTLFSKHDARTTQYIPIELFDDHYFWDI